MRLPQTGIIQSTHNHYGTGSTFLRKDQEMKVLADIEKALKDWYWCFKAWAVTHYILGISSTVCAVIAASSPDVNGRSYLLGYVAVTTAIITFLKAQQKNTAYITAWRNLRAERMAYYANQSDPTKLIQCYKDGEDLISRYD